MRRRIRRNDRDASLGYPYMMSPDGRFYDLVVEAEKHNKPEWTSHTVWVYDNLKQFRIGKRDDSGRVATFEKAIKAGWVKLASIPDMEFIGIEAWTMKQVEFTLDQVLKTNLPGFTAGSSIQIDVTSTGKSMMRGLRKKAPRTLRGLTAMDSLRASAMGKILDERDAFHDELIRRGFDPSKMSDLAHDHLRSKWEMNPARKKKLIVDVLDNGKWSHWTLKYTGVLTSAEVSNAVTKALHRRPVAVIPGTSREVLVEAYGIKPVASHVYVIMSERKYRKNPN